MLQGLSHTFADHACLVAGRCNTQIWGTQPDAIDEAEDRDRWMDLLERLDIKQPPGTMATTEEGALAASKKCVVIVSCRDSICRNST